MEFDQGPPPTFADHFAKAPDLAQFRSDFWWDWGPVFYRGRLDGTAKVLCIASDPGPTERLVGRSLVGDAGQRVQGFLAKLGLTRSYLCLNAFHLALFPSHAWKANSILSEPAFLTWRNQLYDMAKGPKVRAIVAFGVNAQIAADKWSGRGSTTVVKVPHPSSRDTKALLDSWRNAVTTLRANVTRDPDGNASAPNYGSQVTESDYARIPQRDLPFGFPPFVGDDGWGRAASPRHSNSVRRPIPDDFHSLIWIAPKTSS